MVGSNLTQQGGTSFQPKQCDFDRLDVFIILLGAETLPQQAAGVGRRMLLGTWKGKRGEVQSGEELSGASRWQGAGTGKEGAKERKRLS